MFLLILISDITKKITTMENKTILDYQSLADQLFAGGETWKHRTLRTLFDMGSQEWKETTKSEKIEILQKIAHSGTHLLFVVQAYQEHYEKLGRKDIADLKHILCAVTTLFQESLSKKD